MQSSSLSEQREQREFSLKGNTRLAGTLPPLPPPLAPRLPVQARERCLQNSKEIERQMQANRENKLKEGVDMSDAEYLLNKQLLAEADIVLQAKNTITTR